MLFVATPLVILATSFQQTLPKCAQRIKMELWKTAGTDKKISLRKIRENLLWSDIHPPASHKAHEDLINLTNLVSGFLVCFFRPSISCHSQSSWLYPVVALDKPTQDLRVLRTHITTPVAITSLLMRQDINHTIQKTSALRK